jgi:shikimate kinase
MDYKNICLTGFMGSGKSTVGKILADKLGFTFIDLDRVIELTEGKKIKDIFRFRGEKYFRDLETKVTGKIYKNKNCVFACGGGIVKRKNNMDIIKSNSVNIYLNISTSNAIDRLKNVKDRPLIEVENRNDTIAKMIKKRDKLYRKYADIIINNSQKEPLQAANEIITRLKA